jgi:hypothetical protein
LVAADERPIDPTPIHTVDLPATPQRDRNIPATAWIEAPEFIKHGGVNYKRRIGRWLLWREGPAKGDALYTAIDANDLDDVWTFNVYADGTGHGVGPSGATYARFRLWKEDLLSQQ